MMYQKYIKPLLALNQITVEQLAQKMTAASGKKYTRSSLNGKFSRETLSLKECDVIAKILGYRIEFIKESKS